MRRESREGEIRAVDPVRLSAQNARLLEDMRRENRDTRWRLILALVFIFTMAVTIKLIGV